MALTAGNVVLAVDMPTVVTLVEKQTLVRNNGAEVQSGRRAVHRQSSERKWIKPE